MKESHVSLIICAYNEEKYIGECLEYAISNSNGRFFEIIVIDNVSTDKTAEIAKSYKGVRVVREEKKGLTRARERGFKEASGDILAYIDADTRMPEGWLSFLFTQFKYNNDMVCLSGPYMYFNISLWERFLIHAWNMMTILLYNMIGYMVTGGNFAIKKETLNKMNGFDTSIEFYGEDTNIGRRAHAYGKVVFTSKFSMYTSPRRFKDQGLYTTGFLYMKNALSEIFLHKPVTQTYKDFR